MDFWVNLCGSVEHCHGWVSMQSEMGSQWRDLRIGGDATMFCMLHWIQAALFYGSFGMF